MKRITSIMLSAMVVGLAACGSDEAGSAADGATAAATAAPSPGAADAIPPTFVGTIDGSTSRIALTVEGSKAWGYICDPEGNAVGLTGTITGSQLSLSEPDGDVTVTGDLTGDSFTGSASLDGTTDHPVTASLAAGDAGVQLDYAVAGDTSTLSAWIRGNDGEVVGNTTVIVAEGTANADGGSVSATESAGGAPPAAQPTNLRTSIGCFLASRKLVKANATLAANPNMGNISNQVNAVNDYASACGAAFGSQ